MRRRRRRGRKCLTDKINTRRVGEGGLVGGAHGRKRGNHALDAEAVKAAIIPTQFDHLFLVEHKLINPGEKISQHHMKQTMNVDNDGKLKKRRYYEPKNMRRRNMYLDGTEIGAMLAQAAERQSRGKSVGDGGM